MIQFTILIPHKNIPRLLQRCLDSIPRREDIQIIVIDDNSSQDQVDFEHFPGLNDPYVEIVFTKEGKGAGYARNIGLSKAKGKWLLFADADDFYNPCLGDILSEYKENPADIIYFKNDIVNTITCSSVNFQNNWRNKRNNYIDLYKRKPRKAQLLLRYQAGMPWGKIIKRELVERHEIKFDTTSVWNDVRFGYLTGFYASNIAVDERTIYTVTIREGSIQNSELNIEKRLDYIFVAGNLGIFLKEHHIPILMTKHFEQLLWINIHNKPDYFRAKNVLFDLGYCNEEIIVHLLKMKIKAMERNIKKRLLFYIPPVIISNYRRFKHMLFGLLAL
ncbi:glycosyltransferase family 2 protein [Treponema primitia]|uniref:glycosyltransferase family 2 protein n=1 Tax=Treponema primitia TaxID=88058 RepID=UPI0002554EDB|nr:glycosyltransferase family 2 protein [Treponema primitia]